MKIQKIEVQNFKAIDQKNIDLNGCSAIITGANDKGKTSLLRGLIDRMNSEKPEIVVKQGEEKGHNIIELTDGSRIEWHFTQKSERLSYITADGIKQTSGVIGTIGKRYFGEQFDIDQYLNATPKQQLEELKKIAGVDVDKIEAEYKEKYDQRTEAGREVKRLEAKDLDKPKKVDKPDIESIKKRLKDARETNRERTEKLEKLRGLRKVHENIVEYLDGTPFEELFDYDKAIKIIGEIEIPEPVDVESIEEELDDAQTQLRKHDNYQRDLSEYEAWKKSLKSAQEKYEKIDNQVKALEEKKRKAIEDADFPEGFTIENDTVYYNGFPLSDNQLSTSSKYIASIKLGERLLGSVRTLHFDAAPLDKNSLQEIQKWADKKDLQLLIERPDFDGGQIEYQLINK